MPFSWVADPRAEAEGVVLAVDVSRHARSVGFESATFLSRGVWAHFVGAGSAVQDQRLLETLSAVSTQMASPARASEDGTVLTFTLRAAGASEMVVSILDRDRENVTFMLWREFTTRPEDGSLRVRIVAEEEPRLAT